MFGIEIIDAGLLPAMLVAVIAGVLSFLSPCVLPIVPPYLAYMSGVSFDRIRGGEARGRVVRAAFFFGNCFLTRKNVVHIVSRSTEWETF